MTSSNIQISWHNDEKTILYWVHNNKITWQDAHTAQEQLWRLIDTVEHPVDVIIDINHYALPAGAIPNIKRLISNKHCRTNMVVLLHAPPYVSAMFEMVIRVTRGRIKVWRVVDSIDAAERQIYTYRYATK